jgi:hypothetical protein
MKGEKKEENRVAIPTNSSSHPKIENFKIYGEKANFPRQTKINKDSGINWVSGFRLSSNS